MNKEEAIVIDAIASDVQKHMAAFSATELAVQAMLLVLFAIMTVIHILSALFSILSVYAGKALNMLASFFGRICCSVDIPRIATKNMVWVIEQMYLIFSMRRRLKGASARLIPAGPRKVASKKGSVDERTNGTPLSSQKRKRIGTALPPTFLVASPSKEATARSECPWASESAVNPVEHGMLKHGDKNASPEPRLTRPPKQRMRKVRFKGICGCRQQRNRDVIHDATATVANRASRGRRQRRKFVVKSPPSGATFLVESSRTSKRRRAESLGEASEEDRPSKIHALVPKRYSLPSAVRLWRHCFSRRNRLRRLTRHLLRKCKFPLILGNLLVGKTARQEKKREQQNMAMENMDTAYSDEALRRLDNCRKKNELDAELNPPKHLKWTLMDQLGTEFEQLCPEMQQAVRDLLTPGCGTSCCFINSYLSLVARSVNGLEIASRAHKFGDLRYFKEYLRADANKKEAFHNLIKQAFASRAKLSFIFVHEEKIEDDYNEWSHASLLVVDRTRNGQDLIVYMDSGSGEPELGLRDCISEIELTSECAEFIFAQCPVQDEDNGDCGVFTCSFANAYAYAALHSDPTLKVRDVSILSLESSTEKLGYRLRSHVYQSLRCGFLQHGCALFVNFL